MSKTVVVIDDDDDDLEIIEEAISEVDSSILCFTFRKPEEAIEAIATSLNFTPDYVFIDINMAPFTGDKCLVELRKITDRRNTVIVMLSTTISPAVSNRLIQAGANLTFEKPINYAEYHKILNQVLLGSPNKTLL